MPYKKTYRVHTEDHKVLNFKLWLHRDCFFFNIELVDEGVTLTSVPAYLFSEHLENMEDSRPIVRLHKIEELEESLIISANNKGYTSRLISETGLVTSTLVFGSCGKTFNYTVSNRDIFNIMQGVTRMRSSMISADKNEDRVYYQRDAACRKTVRDLLKRLKG